MVLAHNLFKTAYNSIRRHLENPPTNDIPNFMGYCEAFVDAIDHHHDGEVRKDGTPLDIVGLTFVAGSCHVPFPK